jgi:hypothetical protein
VRATEPTLRILGGAAVAAAGAVHLRLWLDGYRSIHAIGPLFLANVVAAGLIAVSLALLRHPLPKLAGIAYAGATLVFFFVSVEHGLFGFREAFSGPEQLAALVAESVAIVALATSLAAGRTSLGDGRPAQVEQLPRGARRLR